MQLEHGLYYVEIPTGERDASGPILKLVGVPCVLQRRRVLTVEKDGDPTIVTTKNRRGVETKKMGRTTIKEDHEVCDIVCMLHDLTPEQATAAEVGGLSQNIGSASVHTGVYEATKPESRRFVSAGMTRPINEAAPTKPKDEPAKGLASKPKADPPAKA